MTIDAFILVSCSVTTTLLGLLIVARNPSQLNNRRFAAIAIALVAWTVFNYLSDNAASNNLLFTRLTFFAGVASIFAVINFVAIFPSESLYKKSTLLFIHKLLTVVLLPIVFMSDFVVSIGFDSDDGALLTTSYLYYLFIFYLVYSLILLFSIIYKQHTNSSLSIRKQQISIISVGFIIYAFLAISSNVVLPALIDDWSISRFGPLFTLFLIGMVAYAIIKHRLFDIGLVVARAVAYILLLATMAITFAGLVIIVPSGLLGDNRPSLIQESYYTLVAVGLAIAFQPLRKFFNKITSKFFYQDAYDPQTFLNELNQVLVSTIDLTKLLNNISVVLENNIKANYCLFALEETKYAERRIIGSEQKSLPEPDLRSLISEVRHLKQKIIAADLLGESQSKLKTVMSKYGIGILVNLTESQKVSNSQLGYILLGAKKSGNPYGSQDIQILEIIADELVIAIQNALRFEEIQKFNITLQEEVKRQTGQLRDANKRLRLLDQTKDDFISMASHQMRTPLTSVKGYLSMVLEGDAGKLNEKEKRLLNQAFISSQRMVYLISDLLNVSRLKTGKFVIENTETNLAEAIAGEVEQLKETAEARNLKLNYQKPENFPTLMLDDTKMRQVLMNFMDNAIHYTPSGGKIDVVLKDTGKAIEFTVTDNGIGVPKAEQHNLFSKFFRAGNAKKARPDGTGLGLYMAQKVIIAQGGSITFHSEEGGGSTFGFSIAKSKLETPGFKKQEEPQVAEKTAKKAAGKVAFRTHDLGEPLDNLRRDDYRREP